MKKTLTLWALAMGDFPTVDLTDDRHEVHTQYGAPYGPHMNVTVTGTTTTTLAMSPLLPDEANGLTKALTSAAEDWAQLTRETGPGGNYFTPCPEQPTAGDVAQNCPHGLLVAHGLVRATGMAPSDISVPSDQQLAIKS